MPMAAYESRITFGLKNKLLVSMMIAGILPLILGMVLSYVQGNKSLRYVIGSNFETLARETANKIDFVIDREIAKNHQTTLDPNLIRWVEKQNAALEAKAEADVINSSPESKERDVQSAIENNGTEALLGFLTEADYTNESTHALFVRSAKGVLVASINDYPPFTRNLDEIREKVQTHGVYLSGLYRDEKINDYVFELVLPIFSQPQKDIKDNAPQKIPLPPGKQGKRPIGLLHRIYSAKEYFKHSLETIRFGDTGHLMIIDGQGVVIDCPILPTGFQIQNRQMVQSVTLPEGGWVRTFDNGHGGSEESIMGFSPLVKTNSLFKKSSGIHWHMFAWQASEEIFAPTRKLLFWNTSAAVLGVVLILLIGTYAANKITRPVRKLQKALVGIGHETSYSLPEIQVDTKDEIGELTSAFNTMSKDLRTTRESELRHLDEMERLIITLAESELRITTVMNNVVEGIITINHQGIIESFNPAAEGIFGYKSDEVKGKNISLLMPEPDKSRHDEYLANYMKTGLGNIIGVGRVVIAQRKDGSTFHMDLSVGKMVIGNQVFFVGVMRDITQRMSMEMDLRKLSQAVEQSPSSVLITDAKGDIEYVNPNFIETSGYAYEEVVGRKPSILKSGVHPPGFYKELWDTILSGKEWRQEFCNRKKNGDLYWELQSISPLRDSNGRITHFLAVKIDDTERKRAEEQLKIYTSELERSNEVKDTLIGELQDLKKRLEVSARTDPLTGLNNRRGMMEKIEYEKLRFDRSKRPFSFMVADIDHFKIINDTYGHDTGDFVLCQVARHFKDFLRGQDTVCRWGGEEFLVLLPETDLNGAFLLAEKLRAGIEEARFEHNSKALRITMSFGLSLFQEPEEDMDACIKRADECLYEAKESGRNRVVSSLKEKRKTPS